MHIGSKNPFFNYTIFSRYGSKNFFKTTLEKDLGISIQNDLKTNQIKYCTSRGNHILGMIAKSFTNLNIYSLTMLYMSLVRPHLEFLINSFLEKDISEIEKVHEERLNNSFTSKI